MCQNTILSHNKSGYIARCKKCNQVQIAFGTTLIAINRAEFENFISYLLVLQANVTNLPPNEKGIWVETACPGVMMVLTPNELQEFLGLLSNSLTKNLSYDTQLNKN